MGNTESYPPPQPQLQRRVRAPPTRHPQQRATYTTQVRQRPAPRQRPKTPAPNPTHIQDKYNQYLESQHQQAGTLVEQYDFSNLNIINVNDRLAQFETAEKKREENFYQEQAQREQHFKNEQDRRKKIFQQEIENFEKSQDDPYAILGLNPREITVAKIKKAYKIRAAKNHPDKGGDENVFKKVTQSYCYLMNKHGHEEELQRKINREVKKQEYQPQMKENEGFENIYINKDNFDINKFNKIFDQFRVESIEDEGYGNLMSGDRRTDEAVSIEKKSIFDNRKFNVDLFNATFKEEAREAGKREMIIYKEPQALLASGNGKIGYQELGKEKIDDFSSSEMDKGLQYTDYKKIYIEPEEFNPDRIQYKQYKNINELKMARDNISFQMSEADRERERLKEMQYQEEEAKRMERMRYEDEIYQQKYNQLNRLLIK